MASSAGQSQLDPQRSLPPLMSQDAAHGLTDIKVAAGPTSHA